MSEDTNINFVALTAEIVGAHVSHNKVSTSEVSELIHGVYAALKGAAVPSEPEATPLQPAVSIRSSVKPDYIVCLEDGAKVTMLKRYLRSRFNLTPEDYRARWGLPRDYPMTAPSYSEKRRTLANAIGLGYKKPLKVDVIEPATKAKRTLKIVTSGDALDKVQMRGSKPSESSLEVQAAVGDTPAEA